MMRMPNIPPCHEDSYYSIGETSNSTKQLLSSSEILSFEPTMGLYPWS